jgi:predicted HNH restriction endonuclease
MKPELDKCILVCANCHSEIHDGITQIPENIPMIANEDFPEEL